MMLRRYNSSTINIIVIFINTNYYMYETNQEIERYQRITKIG